MLPFLRAPTLEPAKGTDQDLAKRSSIGHQTQGFQPHFESNWCHAPSENYKSKEEPVFL